MATTLNLLDGQHSLPLATLPRTFKDAVIITRLLGFRYLWIDSLCILQDSPEDWDLESSRMQNVYKNATLAIAATMTSNANAGILGHCMLPKDTYSLPLYYDSSATKMRGTLHSRRSNVRPGRSQRLPRGPLTERGWTVQEKVLSTRTIHFGHEEIAWDCNTFVEIDAEPYPFFLFDESLRLMTLQLEADRFSTMKVGNAGQDNDNDPLERWYEIIC